MSRKSGTPKTGGRRKGTRNKRSAALVVEAVESGEMPVPMLLGHMRGALIEHFAKDHEGNLVLDKAGQPLKFMAPLSIKDRLQIALGVAPFLHARLSNINHQGEIDVKSLPNDLLDRAIAVASEIAGRLAEPSGGAGPSPAKRRR